MDFQLPTSYGSLTIYGMTENSNTVESIVALPEAGGPAPGHRSAPHRPGIVPEKYFRWRAGEITRLEAFCDVIFGFAITLLVVSLEVPHTYKELMADMRGFLPFAACFAQLALIWRTHYKFSRRYGLEDAYTVFLNVVLLFLVLFYVYPLKFVFTLVFAPLTGASVPEQYEWYQGSILMRIYAVGFTAVFLLFVLMYAHAYRLRRKLELSPVEVYATRFSLQENAILALVGVASFSVAVKSPGWAGWIYIVIGPVLAIHGAIFGKRLRLLAEKLAAAGV
jgi:uncharacterized membrane protein